MAREATLLVLLLVGLLILWRDWGEMQATISADRSPGAYAPGDEPSPDYSSIVLDLNPEYPKFGDN